MGVTQSPGRLDRVRRFTNSIGVRVTLVMILAGTVVATLAVVLVVRAMIANEEGYLVDQTMESVSRTHDDLVTRLATVDTELRGAARLFAAGDAAALPEVLSPFVTGARIGHEGESVDVVRDERARTLLAPSAVSGMQVVDSGILVHRSFGGIDCAALVAISDLVEDTELVRTWISAGDPAGTGSPIGGLTVRRLDRPGGEVAVAAYPLGDAIVVHREASLWPAKHEVDLAVRRAVVVGGVISLGLLILIAWALARGVTRPVRALARSVREGRATLDVGDLPDNEIGELGGAIQQLRSDLARDAQLLQVSAQFAATVAHLKEPDAVLARLQQTLDEVHPGPRWRVLSQDDIEAGASVELGLTREALRAELAAHRGTTGRMLAQPDPTAPVTAPVTALSPSPARVLVSLVEDGTEFGAVIGTAPVAEVELRHVEALAQLVVTTLRGLGLGELAVVNEKLAVIGRMSASIAHEMNNPLAYILNNLIMLEEGLAGEPLEMARDARTGVERLTAIVRDLSSMSRRGVEHLAEVELVELVRHQVKVAGVRARRVELTVVAEGPVTAMCASGPIGQAVLNLVVNAIDAVRARPSPRVIVTVSVDGAFATITVADNGVGIPASTQRKLFDAFFTTKGDHGTGLGLHLSRAFARSHGGELALLASGPGGTSFRLSIPLRPVAEEPASQPAGRARVLVVDDEPLIVRTMERMLSGVADVVGTTDPAAGLRTATDQPFSMVLCDWNMPGMDGAEFLARLRQTNPSNAARVVVMTGGIPPELDGVTVLSKPLQGDAMRRMLAG